MVYGTYDAFGKVKMHHVTWRRCVWCVMRSVYHHQAFVMARRRCYSRISGHPNDVKPLPLRLGNGVVDAEEQELVQSVQSRRLTEEERDVFVASLADVCGMALWASAYRHVSHGDRGASGALDGALIWMALSATKASLEATLLTAFLSLHVDADVKMLTFNPKIYT